MDDIVAGRVASDIPTHGHIDMELDIPGGEDILWDSAVLGSDEAPNGPDIPGGEDILWDSVVLGSKE